MNEKVVMAMIPLTENRLQQSADADLSCVACVQWWNGETSRSSWMSGEHLPPTGGELVNDRSRDEIRKKLFQEVTNNNILNTRA